MSFLAWIDFDQADGDRTRRIMDLFLYDYTEIKLYHEVQKSEDAKSTRRLPM